MPLRASSLIEVRLHVEVGVPLYVPSQRRYVQTIENSREYTSNERRASPGCDIGSDIEADDVSAVVGAGSPSRTGSRAVTLVDGRGTQQTALRTMCRRGADRRRGFAEKRARYADRTAPHTRRARKVIPICSAASRRAPHRSATEGIRAHRTLLKNPAPGVQLYASSLIP